MSVSPLKMRDMSHTATIVRSSLPAGFPQPTKPESSRERITDYYSQLHSQVQRLDSKVEEILAKHELDFMSAFKVHIFGLQKQLLELRRQLQEKETTLYKDQQIQSLSNTVKWFHEEGLKFAEILTRSKQETEKWKSKAQALEADTVFLERQVKTLKRKQRLWEQLAPHKAPPSPLRKADLPDSDPRTVSTKSTSPVRSMEFDLKAVSHPSLAEVISKYGLKDANLCKDLDEVVKTITVKSTEAVKHLQAALERKVRKVNVLIGQKTQQFAAQSELQKLFVGCVEQVRRECGGASGGQEAGEQFLAGDRRKILELFCLNDAVFQEIYDRMFLPPAPHPGFTMKSTPTLPKVRPSPLTPDVLTERSSSHTSPKKSAFAALFSKPSHR